MKENEGQDTAAKAQQSSASADQAKAMPGSEAPKDATATAESVKAGSVLKDKEVELAKARNDSREADQEAEKAREHNVTTNNPRAPEAVAKQHAEVDAAADKRNEENRPGHEKNMERIEAEAHEAHARGAHADHHLAGHVPTGKQNNRNTPRVLPDGTKVWDQ